MLLWQQQQGLNRGNFLNYDSASILLAAIDYKSGIWKRKWIKCILMVMRYRFGGWKLLTSLPLLALIIGIGKRAHNHYNDYNRIIRIIFSFILLFFRFTSLALYSSVSVFCFLKIMTSLVSDRSFPLLMSQRTFYQLFDFLGIWAYFEVSLEVVQT